MLLKIASEKFLEKKREINFEQFAITYVRENIKKYRSKLNGLNGSDKNELIHSAIKIIKNNNQRPAGRLKFSEIKKIVDHFNLDEKKGYKKVWELESIHLEKKPLWIKNNQNEDEEICLIDNLNNKVSISNFSNENIATIDILIDLENKKKFKEIIKKFFVDLNEQEKIIFQKRLFNEKDCYEKLKDISKKLNISIQRINKIEKNLKIKLKNYFIVENKKLTGIK
jgi:RNA polymerase sigma factor (sigma-70 family)